MSVPSLLTWLTSTLATTTTTANTAASTAASAQTDANAAAGAAAAAQTDANTAAAAAVAAQTDANTAAGTAAAAQTDATDALEAANYAKAGFAVNPTVYDLSGATVKTDYAADLSNNKVTIFTSAAETQCIYLPVDPVAIVANTPYRILNNNDPASAGLPIHVQLNDGDGTTADDITTVAPGETCRLVYVSPTNQWFKIVGC